LLKDVRRVGNTPRTLERLTKIQRKMEVKYRSNLTRYAKAAGLEFQEGDPGPGMEEAGGGFPAEAAAGAGGGYGVEEPDSPPYGNVD